MVLSIAPVSISFTFPADLDVSSASVVGDFNEWDPDRGRMQQPHDGSFVARLIDNTFRTGEWHLPPQLDVVVGDISTSTNFQLFGVDVGQTHAEHQPVGQQ